MTTYRYSHGPEERAAAERVNAMLDAAQIGDLFVRPTEADDVRAWVVVNDASRGRAILQIDPDHGTWAHVAQYEVPGDIVPLPRPETAR